MREAAGMEGRVHDLISPREENKRASRGVA